MEEEIGIGAQQALHQRIQPQGRAANVLAQDRRQPIDDVAAERGVLVGKRPAVDEARGTPRAAPPARDCPARRRSARWPSCGPWPDCGRRRSRRRRPRRASHLAGAGRTPWRRSTARHSAAAGKAASGWKSLITSRSRRVGSITSAMSKYSGRLCRSRAMIRQPGLNRRQDSRQACTKGGASAKP